MNNELVSIIVPIYNAEKTLKYCIESIIGQTYSNIEIILVNDGSTDNSKMICEEYASLDKRIKLVNQENNGVSIARNKGIKNSSGRYIQFVDSDDYISNMMTYSLVKRLEDTHGQFVISGVSTLSESYLICDRESLCKKVENLFGNEVITSVWNKLYIKEKINFEFCKDINYGEDILFNLKYLEGIDKIVLIKEGFYNYQHINPISLTRKYNSKRLEMSEIVYLQECEYVTKFRWNLKDIEREIASIYTKNIIYGLYMESVYNTKWLYSKIIIWSEKTSFKNAMRHIKHFSMLYTLSFLLRIKMKRVLKLCFYIRYRIKK